MILFPRFINRYSFVAEPLAQVTPGQLRIGIQARNSKLENISDPGSGMKPETLKYCRSMIGAKSYKLKNISLGIKRAIGAFLKTTPISRIIKLKRIFSLLKGPKLSYSL